MYVKYVQSFRKLEECYDQITHAQKRRILRHVLDGVIGRVIELKHEMINLECSEYHFFDDVLQDLKLTPVCLFFFHQFLKKLKFKNFNKKNLRTTLSFRSRNILFMKKSKLFKKKKSFCPKSSRIWLPKKIRFQHLIKMLIQKHLK